MKKLINVLLVVLMLFVAAACDPETGESTVNDVTFDVDIIKAFSADGKYIFALDDGIDWKYTAEKLDDGYTTGAAEKETELKSDKLTLSFGYWKIALYGYSGDSLIWSGEIDKVTLLDSDTDIKITLTSGVEENNKLFTTVDAAFSAIKEGSNKSVTLYVLKDEVKLEKDIETLIGSDSKAYTITFDGRALEKPVVETRITRDSGHSDKSLYLCGGAGLVFKNITVKIGDDKTNYQGFARASKLVFEDCTIVGRGFDWSKDTTFTNCAFSVSGDWLSAIYIPGTYVFDNCTFNSPDGEFINIYTDNSALTKADCVWNITVRNCSFTGNTTGKEGKGRPVFVIKTKATTNFKSCTINFEGTNTFKGTINEYGTGCPEDKLGDYKDLFAAFGDKSNSVYTWDTTADVTLKSNGTVVYKGPVSQD